jgi:hypothetical protein
MVVRLRFLLFVVRSAPVRPVVVRLPEELVLVAPTRFTLVLVVLERGMVTILSCLGAHM